MLNYAVYSEEKTFSLRWIGFRESYQEGVFAEFSMFIIGR